MKLDVNRLLNRYIVLTDDARARQAGATYLIFGPIHNIEKTESGLYLSIRETEHGVDINLDKDGKTEDIEFISQFLWKALLYIAETGRK